MCEWAEKKEEERIGRLKGGGGREGVREEEWERERVGKGGSE